MPKKIRPVRVEGQLAYVPLTMGYIATIDVSDVQIVADVNWHVRIDGARFYAACNLPKDGNGRRGSIYMHRLLMGSPTLMEVDHIDRNGLNNTRQNLRVVTRAQNQSNRKTSSLSQSGMKGVSPHGKNGTWKARISVNGKRICLGYYRTPDEAYASYCKASAELHGQHGRTK